MSTSGAGGMRFKSRGPSRSISHTAHIANNLPQEIVPDNE